jgi:holo-[acyl-carrier protein] synthase
LIGLGADVVDLDRFAVVLDRRPSFVARVFTDAERAYCDTSAAPSTRCERYAARFAAKEAVMKVLGCGLGAYKFHDVAVARAESGEPSLIVGGHAAVLAEELGVSRWLVSLTHSELVAMAVVVAE